MTRGGRFSFFVALFLESMAVMAGISQTLKEVSQTTKEVSQNTKDITLLTVEALRLGRETSERVAEILGKNRKH